MIGEQAESVINRFGVEAYNGDSWTSLDLKLSQNIFTS